MSLSFFATLKQTGPDCHIYVMSQEKKGHFYIYDNFYKCRPIFIIFSLLNSENNCRGSWN